jgi:hypothetical protein
MDFLKKFASEATGTNTTAPATTEKKDSGEQTAPSQADLYSSAQVVAEAARSTFQKEPNKVDNAKVAGAAADLLDAAERYGKLDSSTGIGSYVEKAENYLHQYESSHSTTPAKSTPEEPEKKTTAPAPKETAPPAEAEEATKPEGGIGDYVKTAEGFLKRGSESKTDESGDSGSGYGGMMKMAGDFLKKN